MLPSPSMEILVIDVKYHHAGNDALGAERLAVFTAQIEQQLQFRRDQLTEQEVDARVETEADREIRDTLMRGAIAALTEIQAARDRLADGRFGRCVDCGEDLPTERLEALPWVARCIWCHHATSAERHR